MKDLTMLEFAQEVIKVVGNNLKLNKVSMVGKKINGEVENLLLVDTDEAYVRYNISNDEYLIKRK